MPAYLFLINSMVIPLFRSLIKMLCKTLSLCPEEIGSDLASYHLGEMKEVVAPDL